jgi:hypothetical protein
MVGREEFKVEEMYLRKDQEWSCHALISQKPPNPLFFAGSNALAILVETDRAQASDESEIYL